MSKIEVIYTDICGNVSTVSLEQKDNINSPQLLEWFEGTALAGLGFYVGEKK